MDPQLYSFLSSMAEAGRARSMPLSEAPVAALLYALASSCRSGRALDVGTSIGYSTLVMAAAMNLIEVPSSSKYVFCRELNNAEAIEELARRPKCAFRQCDPDMARIVTIERDPRRVVEACSAFRQCALGNEVAVMWGEAHESIGCLNAPFDLAFLDAGKSENSHYIALMESRGLLAEGAVVLVDNLGFRPSLRSLRHERIRMEMRRFVREMEAREDWSVLRLDIADGVLVCTRKRIGSSNAEFSIVGSCEL